MKENGAGNLEWIIFLASGQGYNYKFMLIMFSSSIHIFFVKVCLYPTQCVCSWTYNGTYDHQI